MPDIAVFLDAAGTVADFDTHIRGVLARIVAKMESRWPGQVPALTVDELVEDREAAAAACEGYVDIETAWRAGIARTLGRLGLGDEEDAADLGEHLIALRRRPVPLYPEALEELRALPRGCAIGILTNGTFPPGTALDPLLSARMESAALKVAKPSPEIFAAAMRMLPAHRYVMVGDDPRNDIDGAAAAGWATVWVNREGLGPGAHRADAELPDLRGLAAVIRRIAGRP